MTEQAGQTNSVPVNTNRQPAHAGRGAGSNPKNRFERLEYVPEPEDTDEEQPLPRTQFLQVGTQSIITRNDSPDVPFTYSCNPYRGCEHGCAYCYARPTHEYLGFSAGLDFENKIMVKEDAPELLRRAFENVIRNAVKYSPAGQRVEIHLDADSAAARVRAWCWQFSQSIVLRAAALRFRGAHRLPFRPARSAGQWR